MARNLKLTTYKRSDIDGVFKTEKKKLKTLLNGLVFEIEHFGSTAIPGTFGKGMIDIMFIFPSERVQLQALEKLKQAGYRQGELNKKRDGRFFLTNNQNQSQAGDVHLHLVIKDTDQHKGPLFFKKHLLENHKDVEEYNKLKKKLASKFNFDRKSYALGKRDFIEKIVEIAKKN